MRKSSLAVSHGPPIHAESTSGMVGHRSVQVDISMSLSMSISMQAVAYSRTVAASAVEQAYFQFSLIIPCCGPGRGPGRGRVVRTTGTLQGQAPRNPTERVQKFPGISAKIPSVETEIGLRRCARPD